MMIFLAASAEGMSKVGSAFQSLVVLEMQLDITVSPGC